MKTMLSGIKPTGNLTLGNYIGAIREFVKYQDEYNLYVFIADLHSLTIYQDPSDLRKNTENLVATYIAAGLDPKKCTLFRQSDISAHNQLEWILTCNTDLPDLTKMPQYKNFLDKHKGEATPTGMLMYPSLMNSDILLYEADYIPVGEDQVPHVELTHTIADRFNKRYGETFKLPEPIMAKTGAKIMSLSDPTKKMSKSESDKGTIYLFDDAETIRKKIRKATTDAESKIYYDPVNKPGISNLLTIMASLSNKSIKELEEYYKDEKDYGKFKNDVADVVIEELTKLQDKINKIKEDKAFLEGTLYLGKLKAEKIAHLKINEVYKKVGLR